MITIFHCDNINCDEQLTMIDIVHMLADRDLRHVLEQIFSYLDAQSLMSVEMVSPTWANVVNTSNVAYRLKVVINNPLPQKTSPIFEGLKI